MTMVFKATGLYQVAIEGAVPSEGCSESEIEAYEEIRSASMVMFIQLISQQILSQCYRLTDPYKLWIHLKTQFYSDTAYSFVFQIHVLFSVEYEQDKPITEFIDKFEAEWAILTQMATSGSSTYRTKLIEFLDQDEAKRDVLLSTLIPYMTNVIDNISTKGDISYAEAKQRLIGLPSNQKIIQDSTFVAYRKRKVLNNNTPNNNTPNNNNQTKTPVSIGKLAQICCTWCKKHGHPFEGHMWYHCSRLKEEQKKKAQSAHVSAESTEACITDVALTAVSTPIHSAWIFDTGSSSHMTSDLDKFETIIANHGTVKVGGGVILVHEGKGTCLVHPLLPDGTTTTVRLVNVLYVPTLGHSLLSWNVLRSRFTCEMGGKDVLVKLNGSVVLHGEFAGNLPYLNENKNNEHDTTHNALVTAASKSHIHWHEAFGHVNSMFQQKAYYEDGTILPELPSGFQFDCDACSLSKSVHHVPKPTMTRATKPLELIYSDLSGKAPVPSMGGNYYYLTLIDDCTRFSWIYFLKNKSDAPAAIKDFVKKVQRQTNY